MEKETIYSILMADDVVASIHNNLNILLNFIPELSDMIGFEHNHPHHHLDVWNHTLLALHNAPKDAEIRLVLLLHDIGKPHSYQDEEIRHFRGHPKVSAYIALSILKRLHFNQDEIERLCYLIEQHDTPITEEEIKNNKALAHTKFIIQYCDALAHNPSKLEKRITYLRNINEKLNQSEKNIKNKYLNWTNKRQKNKR